jgi:hypothetical protein
MTHKSLKKDNSAIPNTNINFHNDIEELAKDPEKNYDKLLKIYQLLLQKYYLIKNK